MKNTNIRLVLFMNDLTANKTQVMWTGSCLVKISPSR